MNELIEKLKKNEKPFGLLDPEEQKYLKKVGINNCRIFFIQNEWSMAGGSFIAFYTYAIKPDYQPEPEFVDLEIRSDSTNDWLGVPDCGGNYDWLPYHFTHLHCLPSLPNFVGFHYDEETTVRFEDVANLIDKKDTVFVRFRV